MHFNIEQLPPTKFQLNIEESKLKDQIELLVFKKWAYLLLGLITVALTEIFILNLLNSYQIDQEIVILFVSLIMIIAAIVIYQITQVFNTKQKEITTQIEEVSFFHEEAIYRSNVKNVIFSDNEKINAYVMAVSRQGRTLTYGEYLALKEWINRE